MKRVLVKSIHEAFDYVLQHYYPFGMETEAAEQGALTDTYIVISIQDSHTGGFGVKFNENYFCKGVLTLYFDDVEKEINGAVLFDDDMADQIIDFIETHKKAADTLLVHCYAGQSRSRAVGAFAIKMLGGDNSKYFKESAPNMFVYDALESAWIRRVSQQLFPQH